MKLTKILIALVFSVSVIMANTPFNTEAVPDVLNTSLWSAPQGYTFSAGDTTTTFNFADAKMFELTIRDSTMSGTDSIGVWYKEVYNGISFYSSFQVMAGSQTTYTTTINSALLQPTDGLTVTYTWYAGGKIMGADIAKTGTIYVARLNQPPTAAGYAPKTRIIFKYY